MAWSTAEFLAKAGNDVILQDGVFAYNFTASGTIYEGQAVALVAGMNNTVMVTSAEAIGANCIGFATMGSTHGKWIAVAGPGNICWAETEDATVAGTPLYGDAYGCLDETAGNSTKIAGYAINTAASSAIAGYSKKFVKVLVV